MKKFSRSLKSVFALALALMLTMSLVACGGSSSSSSAPASSAASGSSAASSEAAPAEKIPLKISHHPYIHALPSVYAEQNGMYDKYDYEMTMYSGGPTQNEAISSGAWEVGTTGTGGAVLGAAGYNMKVIGFTCTDSNTVDLWVRPDSPLLQAPQDENGIYGTAEDWKGLKILCPTGTSCQMVLIGTLEHLGLTQSDVEVIDMPVASSYPAFKAGEADVVALWSPFGFAAEEEEGWVKVSSAKQLGLNLPCLIVATEEAVNNRRDVVQDWLQTYIDAGIALNNQDTEVTAQLLYDFEKQEGIKMEEYASVLEVENRRFPTVEENKALFTVGEDGTCEAEKIVLQFVDFMISQGKMTEADKQTMIDNHFVDTSFMENIK